MTPELIKQWEKERTDKDREYLTKFISKYYRGGESNNE